MTKPAVSCRFGRIYWRNPQWKTSFFYSALSGFSSIARIANRIQRILKIMTKYMFCKWLKPTLSLIRWVEPKELGKLKLLLGRDLLNSKNHSFKSLSEEEERLFESNLFHYIIMINKKSVFKEFVIGFDWRQFLRVTIRICRWWLRNSMGK